MNPAIGLITLNAKFIHSSLSLRYLRNAARQAGYSRIWLREFTIHHPLWKIALEIQNQNLDILGVSVYIWNRKPTLELIERLQKQNPKLRIVVGGPEVSFEKHPLSGCTLIAGEGESKWVQCLGYMARGESPPVEIVEGWRTHGTDLPALIPPYLPEDLPQLKNRFAYLEASRGCPYRCSFCLSALDEKVRFFDENVVQQQLRLLLEGGVRKIKFVDRTFNLSPQRMQRLIQWLSRYPDREFHFEVVGDLLSADMLTFLQAVPPGMFQFEIGVQTLDTAVNNRLDRHQDNGKLFRAIRRLIAEERIHVHCDLIFGLPGETLEGTMESFEEVFALNPHALQLGFLKFLPGAPIHRWVEPYGYVFQSAPPYEVIGNRDLSPEEILHLKEFAEVFDLFNNSKRFQFSINHQVTRQRPRALFEKLLQGLKARGPSENALSLEGQYQVFSETFKVEEEPLAMDLLKLDYLYNQRNYRLPDFMRQQGWSDSAAKLGAWEGDRKTPIVAFRHEIQGQGSQIVLTPAPTVRYYAIAHAAGSSGYLRRPRVHAVPV
ncbi:MAG: DUF4080 domain-containing protein [Nitrospinaceae bacterium]